MEYKPNLHQSTFCEYCFLYLPDSLMNKHLNSVTHKTNIQDAIARIKYDIYKGRNKFRVSRIMS